MIYPDVDGYYPYYMYSKESLPKVPIIDTTFPKECGQKLLKRKRGRK